MRSATLTLKLPLKLPKQIVDLSKMLIFPKKSICPINSHMFGSSNHDQSWLVVEKNNHHDTDKTHFLPIQEPAAMGSTDVHIWVSVVHLHVTWFKIHGTQNSAIDGWKPVSWERDSQNMPKTKLISQANMINWTILRSPQETHRFWWKSTKPRTVLPLAALEARNPDP